METKKNIKGFIDGLSKDELSACIRFLRERGIAKMEEARRRGLLEITGPNGQEVDLQLEPPIQLSEETEMKLLEFIYNLTDEEFIEALFALVAGYKSRRGVLNQYSEDQYQKG